MSATKPTATLALWILLTISATMCPAQTTPNNILNPSQQWTGPVLPLHRTFHMGFTGFPYDATLQALIDTRAFINQHADIIAIHNDHGVPWPEALEGQDNYSQSLLNNITNALDGIDPNKAVYVSATAQSPLRNDQLANYWGTTTNMPLPPDWATKPIDHPDVIAAYLNWCRFLIAQLNPDYFAYGIESNGGFSSINDPNFIRFHNFIQAIYPTLKTENPDIPIFLSVQTSNTDATRADFLELTAELLQYSDWIAISSYPYFRWDPKSPIGITTAGHPNEIPADHLSAIRDLDPDKPIAIAETGYPAQDLILPTLGINQPATPQWQQLYVNQLLRELNQFNAEFIIWFLPRDHDLLNDRIFPKGTTDPVFLIWRDTGLLDEAGLPRLALEYWNHWLGLPLSQSHALSTKEHLQSPHAKKYLRKLMTSEPPEPCPKSTP